VEVAGFSGSARRVPLALGFISMALQTVLFREHLLVYSGNEVGIGMFLGAWLIWTGVGGALGAPLSRRVKARGFALVLAAYPLALIPQLVAYWHLRDLAGLDPFQRFPLGLLGLATLLTTVPVSLLGGVLFTWTAARWKSDSLDGTSPAVRVYAWEAFGGFLGGLTVTVSLLAHVPPPATCAVLFLLFGGLAASGLWAEGHRSGAAWNGLVAAGTSVVFLAVGPSIWLLRQHTLPIPPGMELVRLVDSPHQAISVVRGETGNVLYGNGSYVMALPAWEDASELAGFLVGVADVRRNVLILGSGHESLACVLARWFEVTVVQPDARWTQVVDETLAVLPGQDACSQAYRRVHADPRAWLARQSDTYDMIVLGTSDPMTASSGRLYSREMFSLVHSSLAAGGVMALVTLLSENVLSGEGLRYGASLIQTVADVFPVVRTVGGEHMWVFASLNDSRISVEPSRVVQRIQTMIPGFPEHLLLGIPGRFEPARDQGRTRILLEAPSGEISEDDRPALFLSRLVLEYRESRLMSWVGRAGSNAVWMIAVLWLCCLPGVFWAGARSRHSTIWSAWGLLVIGMTGMAGQSALLLAYQFRFGTLLGEFGLLNGLFMLGLGTGSLLRTSGLASAGLGGRLASGVGLAVVNGAIWAVLAGIQPTDVWGRVLLMAMAGVLGTVLGVTMAEGVRRWAEGVRDVAAAAARLEVLDHAGGVVGAVLGSLFLIPFAGPRGTFLILAGASLTVVPFMTLASRSPGPSRDGRGPLLRAWTEAGFVTAVLWTLVILTWPSVERPGDTNASGVSLSGPPAWEELVSGRGGGGDDDAQVVGDIRSDERPSLGAEENEDNEDAEDNAAQELTGCSGEKSDDLPRLQRTENSQHPFQRTVPLDRWLNRIREGTLSERESLYYLPVP
jgi:spermidine synthase